MTDLSLQDRLILTAATLTRWGIQVRSALPVDERAGRAALGFATPGGSWMFWTQRDDRAFDRTGRLCSDLTLHCGDAAVIAAARSAGRMWGLDGLRPDGEHALVLSANAPAPHYGLRRHPVTGRASSDLARHGG
jgi:hypothetical protein